HVAGELSRMKGHGGAYAQYFEAASHIGEAVAAFDQQQAAAADVTDEAARPGLLNEAYFRLAAALERPRALLAGVLKQHPDWPIAHHALGDIVHLQGDREQAATHAAKALALGGCPAIGISRVLEDLALRNGPAASGEPLAGAVVDPIPVLILGDLAHLAWRSALERGQFERADQLASGVPRAANDVGDGFVEAAWRISRGERGPEIASLLRKAAIKVADRDSSMAGEVSVALVASQVRMGDAEAAAREVEQIDEALRGLPVPWRPLTLARCYELIGDAARAEEQYLAVLRFDPGFLRRMSVVDFYVRQERDAEAARHLNLLLDTAGGMTRDGLAWAVRRRAQVIAPAETEDGVLTAVEALRRNGRAGSRQSITVLPAAGSAGDSLAGLTYFRLACTQADAGNLDSARRSFALARQNGFDNDRLPPLERPALERLTQLIGHSTE
ncbi:MAG TPA: hypothetical protein VML55_16910, partial [Planctomycetaceae bacterium]|nr:hypothetical protein [Planctomycetaceae bacterium]